MLNSHTNSELKLLIVGDYLFEPKIGLLSGPSGSHHIGPQMAAVLSYLIEQSNQVVEREYLISEIWPDDSQSSHSLTHCVGRLRHYFDDTAKAANYIETVPNQGYRLVAPVYGTTNRPVVVNPALHNSQHRKVCRSLLIYTMVIWLMFQVSEIVVPALNLPEWFNRLVVVLGLLGFPVAATLSWIFNLTPSGVVRDPKGASNLHSTHARSRTELVFDSALILVALVICGMLVLAGLG